MELCHLESIGLPIQRLNGAGLNGAGQAKAPQVKPAALNGAKSDREMKPQNALQQPAAHATRPLYMDGTYVFHCEASVELLQLKEEDPSILLVELEQTIFHPQGGGQPSDTGILKADGLPDLTVTFVCKDKAKEGVIRHECKGSTDELQKWLRRSQACQAFQVRCLVDELQRRRNARLHSAGHLLDVAIYELGFRWQAGKGYHFEEGPYVEYIPTKEGRQLDVKDAKAKDAAITEISQKMKELIAKNVPTEVAFVDGMRTVKMEGVSCGCGGTHVEGSGEIGEVSIKKIQGAPRRYLEESRLFERNARLRYGQMWQEMNAKFKCFDSH